MKMNRMAALCLLIAAPLMAPAAHAEGLDAEVNYGRADGHWGTEIGAGYAFDMAGFSLTPGRHVIAGASPPRDYRAETSVDGKAWEPAAQGEFANIAYALSTQRIAFATPRAARFLRLSFGATAVPAARMTIAGIGAFTKK